MKKELEDEIAQAKERDSLKFLFSFRNYRIGIALHGTKAFFLLLAIAYFYLAFTYIPSLMTGLEGVIGAMAFLLASTEYRNGHKLAEITKLVDNIRVHLSTEDDKLRACIHTVSAYQHKPCKESIKNLEETFSGWFHNRLEHCVGNGLPLLLNKLIASQELKKRAEIHTRTSRELVNLLSKYSEPLIVLLPEESLPKMTKEECERILDKLYDMLLISGKLERSLMDEHTSYVMY